VRGFQMPARSKSILPVLARRVAVSITCVSVSALQGPLIIIGRLFQAAKMLFDMLCILNN
jgi:hypothetical protein